MDESINARLVQARVGSLEQQLRAATSRDDSPLEEVTK